MAGIGPEPKDPNARARGKRGDTIRSIEVEPSPQPPLPDDRNWPKRTQEFWRVWGESPLTAGFTAAEWDYMLDTAYIHARLWQGDAKQAGELRLRLAKVGATAEDRARLRIVFAQANEADKPAAEPAKAAQEHYEGLKLVTGV